MLNKIMKITNIVFIISFLIMIVSSIVFMSEKNMFSDVGGFSALTLMLSSAVFFLILFKKGRDWYYH